jgi:hypothetical protein
MSAPLLDPAKTHSADAPVLFAVELSGKVARVTGSHRHARGQIFGAVRGLLCLLELMTANGSCLRSTQSGFRRTGRILFVHTARLQVGASTSVKALARIFRMNLARSALPACYARP